MTTPSASTPQRFPTIGHALAAAIQRAKAHEGRGLRPVRVRFSLRFGDDRADGLHVIAFVPARSQAELDALDGARSRCQRLIPWAEFDRVALAGGLTDIVDDVSVAALAALGLDAPARLQ